MHSNINLPNDDYLRIKVIPNSPKNEIVEILKQEESKTIKIKIKAPPEKNKANKELIKFLSKKLNINKQYIKILNGHTDQIKLIKVSRNATNQ